LLYKRIGNLRAKRLRAGLFSLFVLLIGIGAMAAPAYAATGKAHVCKVIGTDVPPGGANYYHEAVICTDLLEVYYPWSGTYVAEGQTEAICQTNTAVIQQCADIVVYNETAWSNSTGTHTRGTVGHCGHAYPACPVGRFYVTAPDSDTDFCMPNTWGVTDGKFANGDPSTVIQLPGSGAKIALAAAYGTPHVSVGNC
jgi:hypothetical protein